LPERPQFRLGELLLQQGVINRAQLQQALARQGQAGGRLGSNLIAIGALDEATLARILAEQLRIASATATQLEKATRAAINLIPRELAVRFRAVPLRIDGKRLWVAFADPTDREAIATLERGTGLEVRAMVAPDVLIDFGLGKHYGVERQARVVEIRDSGLLEIGPPPGEAAVYDARPTSSTAGSALGFLDERSDEAAVRAQPIAHTRPLALGVAPPPIPRDTSRPAPAKSKIITTPMVAAEPRTGTLDPDQLRARLLSVVTDEQIFEAALDALHPCVGRLALMLIQAGVLVAYRGRGIDPRSLELLRFSLEGAPAMARLLEAAVPHVGPLPSQLGSFFQEVGTPNGLFLPVTLGKRAVGALIGGEVAADLPARAAELTRIGTLLDLALHASHVRQRLARS
jgi:hypothetical protein